MRFSVVIPTFNRSDKLDRCLEHLFAADFPSQQFEIRVADDGSSDETPEVLEAAQARSPVPLEILRQANRGPAAARNAAAREARGELLLFLDDDVQVTPDLLAVHDARHRAADPETIAVLGHIDWCTDLEVTPFMEWLVAGGPQFNFGMIRDAEHVGYEFFYTANISVPRLEFERVGGFDEGFPAAAGEDTELSYRLRDRLRLVYEPSALVHHDHHIERRPYRLRMERVGQSAAWIARKHPELAPAIEKHVGTRGRRTARARLLATALLLESWLPNRTRRKLYRSELKEAFARGYLAAYRTSE